MEDSENLSRRQSEVSPVQSRPTNSEKAQVFHQVLRRLRELDVDEAAELGFQDELSAHFSKLPLRYALDLNVEWAQNVVMHKILLNMARDPLAGLAVDVRLVQGCPTSDGDLGEGRDAIQQDSLYPPPALGLSDFSRPMHEITISAKDKHKWLTEISRLMTEIGIVIQECYVYSSTDRYLFGVFLVDGWNTGIDNLRRKLVKEITILAAAKDNNDNDV